MDNTLFNKSLFNSYLSKSIGSTGAVFFSGVGSGGFSSAGFDSSGSSFIVPSGFSSTFGIWSHISDILIDGGKLSNPKPLINDDKFGTFAPYFSFNSAIFAAKPSGVVSAARPNNSCCNPPILGNSGLNDSKSAFNSFNLEVIEDS